MDEGLRDLEAIMEANLASAAVERRLVSGGDAAAEEQQQQPGEVKQQLEHEVTSDEAQPQQPAIPHFAPCANVASLSLALGSVMSSNFVLSKVGFVPRRSAAPAVPKPPAAAKPSLPSQKKSLAPNPVKPSSRFKLGLHVNGLSPAATKASKGSSTAFPDYQMLPKSGKTYGAPSGGAAMKKASIVWFRSDLRVHDNEALASANKESLSVIPLYCFDPRDYGKSSAGFDKTGPYRAKFLLECVNTLRDNLRERGSELVVRVGNPVEVLATLAKAVGADGFYAHQETSAEELALEDRVSAALKDQGVDVKYFWGSTLFHVDDLPFKLEEMPVTYGAFRDRVKDVTVRPAAEAGKQLKGLPSQGNVKPGDIPTLQELGLNPSSATLQDKSGPKGATLIGGENEALKRLKTIVAEGGPVKNKVAASKSDESFYGTTVSCKVSPWLAMGCLSPRKMFEDLVKNNTGRIQMQAPNPANPQEPHWLVCELLWRDFFRFITKKFGAAKRSQTSGAPCGPALAAAY